MRGTIFLTIIRAVAPIVGARMELLDSGSPSTALSLPALWNGRHPILKERFFGLTNAEGNHGEDCNELYYYLDAAPTHAYLENPLHIFHGDNGRGVGASIRPVGPA